MLAGDLHHEEDEAMDLVDDAACTCSCAHCGMPFRTDAGAMVMVLEPHIEERAGLASTLNGSMATLMAI